MKNTLKNTNYTYAWIPNCLILNVEKTKNIYSLRILRSIFTVPLNSIPDNGYIEVSTDLITDKKLNGSTCVTIKNACKEVLKTQIEIKTEVKNRFKLINIFSSVERDGRILKIKLNSDAIQTLIEEQSKGFTKIPCEKTLIFDSAYEHKWFEILCRIEGYRKKIIYEIPNLKNYLGANNLRKWSHFKQKGIVNPFEGINKKFGTSIGFRCIKKGRSICAVEIFDKKGCGITLTKNNTKEELNSSQSKQVNVPVEEKKHKFACNCFDALPESKQNNYQSESSWFKNDEFKRLDAIDKFKKKHAPLLENAKTVEDVLCAIDMPST